MYRICQTIPIEDVLRKLGVRFNSTQTKIKCPIRSHHRRGDVNPSCKIYSNSNMIYCFVASKGWRPVELIMEVKELTKKEAVDWLVKRFNLKQTPQKRFANLVRCVVNENSYKRRLVVSIKLVEEINKIIRSMGNDWTIISPIIDDALDNFDVYCIDIRDLVKWQNEWKGVFKFFIKEQFKYNVWMDRGG